MLSPQEFAAKIRAKYPGPYDALSDEDLTGRVLKKYPQYASVVATPPSQLEMGPGNGPYPVSTYTETPPEVGAVLSGALPNAAAGVGSAIAETAGGVPDAIRDAISGLKGMLPNRSLRAMGYGAGQLGTPVMQDMAQGARAFASEAQPELGQTIARAMSGGNSQALAIPEEVAGAGDIAATNSPAQTAIFNKPLEEGLSRSVAQNLDVATEQWKQTGEAIKNTLANLDATGTKFDPEPILKQIEDMYERDANGAIMTAGVQGETNEAISDALASLKDYAKGEKISWSDANRVKSMLQDSASYASKRFEQSNEAYKTVASLIKEGVDDQAEKAIGPEGVQDFQQLRGAYRYLSSLKQAYTAGKTRELLQPSLAETALTSVKRALPYVTGYEVLRRMF